MKFYIKTILYSFFVIVLFSTTSVFAAPASLSITKPSGSVQEGDRVTLSIKVESTDQAINAISGVVSFSEDTLKTISVSRDSSILNIWTRDPNVGRNKVTFEGVILNPGYRGAGGTLFNITFEAKKSGRATVSFTEGAILANDGLGTNVISGLSSINFNITPGAGALDLSGVPIAQTTPRRLQALPVITEYSQSVYSKQTAYLRGRGEPGAMTKISFEDLSQKSFGEQFLDFVQSKKKRLSDVLVQNNEKGLFEYVTPNNLIAGVYNATPFLVEDDTNIEKPGLGVQLFVNDSKIVKGLIVFINILLLLIPIVGLIMLIYFIPWYSSRRMRIMKRRMGLEEEKIILTEHHLEHEDKLLYKDPLENTNTEKSS
jgi:hypothetical protein